MQVVWLFENVLWKFSEDIAYNQRKELAKKVLAETYGYKDIYSFIKPELDVDWTDRFFKTVFTYYENREIWAEQKKS